MTNFESARGGQVSNVAGQTVVKSTGSKTRLSRMKLENTKYKKDESEATSIIRHLSFAIRHFNKGAFNDIHIPHRP